MSEDHSYEILTEIGLIKAHLAKIDERLLNHLEWEEKGSKWIGNTLFPVTVSSVIAFLVTFFK